MKLFSCLRSSQAKSLGWNGCPRGSNKLINLFRSIYLKSSRVTVGRGWSELARLNENGQIDETQKGTSGLITISWCRTAKL